VNNVNNDKIHQIDTPSLTFVSMAQRNQDKQMIKYLYRQHVRVGAPAAFHL
jgi:hypothetical protein